MASRWLLLLSLLAPLLIATACLAAKRPCYSPEEAAAHAGKEICLSAHVYDVAEDPDGTRYLDVCKPGSPDESCRFSVVSLAQDRATVGPLTKLAMQDVQLRGTVRAIGGRSLILLSDQRQLHDGPEKFRPNPELMRGFSAGTADTAFHDPAMNTRRHSKSAFAGTQH